MKAKYILYSLLVLVFAFVPFQPSPTAYIIIDEIYDMTPCVEWGDWQIGQSSGSGTAVSTSFITNSERTCCVKVSVNYCASQPSVLVYPITDFGFEITMNNGFAVSKKSYSMSGPDASQLYINRIPKRTKNNATSLISLVRGESNATPVT